MLTDEQYRALGMFVVSFNSMEEVYDLALPLLIGCHEPSLSDFLAGVGDSFSKKVDRVARVVERIAADRKSLKPLAENIKDHVKEVKDLIDERNRIVHSFPSANAETNEWLLKNRKGIVIPSDVDTIETLAIRASKLGTAGIHLFMKFQRAAWELRGYPPEDPLTGLRSDLDPE